MAQNETLKDTQSTLKVVIPDQLKAQLVKRAEQERRTITVVVMQALESYLAQPIS